MVPLHLASHLEELLHVAQEVEPVPRRFIRLPHARDWVLFLLRFLARSLRVAALGALFPLLEPERGARRGARPPRLVSPLLRRPRPHLVLVLGHVRLHLVLLLHLLLALHAPVRGDGHGLRDVVAVVRLRLLDVLLPRLKLGELLRVLVRGELDVILLLNLVGVHAHGRGVVRRVHDVDDLAVLGLAHDPATARAARLVLVLVVAAAAAGAVDAVELLPLLKLLLRLRRLLVGDLVVVRVAPFGGAPLALALARGERLSHGELETSPMFSAATLASSGPWVFHPALLCPSASVTFASTIFFPFAFIHFLYSASTTPMSGWGFFHCACTAAFSACTSA